MNRARTHLLAGVVFAAVVLAGSWAGAAPATPQAPAPPAVAYLDQLTQAVQRTRSRMGLFTASAEKAAGRIIQGGRIFVAGPQRTFIAEARGRSGGLMALQAVGPQTVAQAGDVLLAASVRPWTPEQIGMLQTWISAGAQVVLFSPAVPPELEPHVDAIAPMAEPGLRVRADFYPLDTVVNLVDLWTWTGEFVAACTRQGRMPVLYQSYGIPGGRERGRKYRGRVFHEDFDIPPIDAGVLGGAYLDSIEASLRGLAQEAGELAQASRWLREADEAHRCLGGIAHVYPGLFQDARAPVVFGTVLKRNQAVPEACAFVLHLSYQEPLQPLLDQARGGAFRLVYCSVQPGEATAPNILHLDPHWALADAAVTVEGYDIPILPPSGVMQAAIYWSIVAGRP